jgi:hypothetical protein
VVVACVALHPPLAAYLLIGITPLVAGIDRGLVIPVVRPNEALLALMAAGLIAHSFTRLRTGTALRFRLDRTGASILVLAVAASVVPLAWMLLRGQQIAQDDILYALIPWKYYGVYLVTRASVRTERHIRTCLWISMVVASFVAFLAILQALQLFGVTHALATYYKPYGSSQALVNGRGGSTLSLPIAVADLMTFNLAIAVGMLNLGLGRRLPLIAMGMLFVAGVLAAAEFSGAIGLVIGVIVMAIITRRIRSVAAFTPVFIGAAFALRPVIATRAAGFQSASGLPTSWIGRIPNLTSYFWPVLFSHGNFILGVRPAARVATRTMATGFIWIESGYTWLLWSGGIPFLGAYFYFVWTNLRLALAAARERVDEVGVVGLAIVVALVVISILMILDPHLTYRGSADLLFMLLGLLTVGMRSSGAEQESAAVGDRSRS